MFSLSTRDRIIYAFNLGPLVNTTQDISLYIDKDYYISLRFNTYSFIQQSSLSLVVLVNGLYKLVSRKVQPIDLSKSIGLAPSRLDNQKEVLEEREGISIPRVE